MKVILNKVVCKTAQRPFKILPGSLKLICVYTSAKLFLHYRF